MYTVEIQKHGLPHEHLLIFLHPANKYPNVKILTRSYQLRFYVLFKSQNCINVSRNTWYMVHVGQLIIPFLVWKMVNAQDSFPKKFTPLLPYLKMAILIIIEGTICPQSSKMVSA